MPRNAVDRIIALSHPRTGAPVRPCACSFVRLCVCASVQRYFHSKVQHNAFARSSTLKGTGEEEATESAGAFGGRAPTTFAG